MNMRHILVTTIISDLCCHVMHDILAVALINIELSLSERTGVSKEIKIALSELVQRRPRDPLSYLARQYPWGVASACSYVNTVHDEQDDNFVGFHDDLKL